MPLTVCWAGATPFLIVAGGKNEGRGLSSLNILLLGKETVSVNYDKGVEGGEKKEEPEGGFLQHLVIVKHFLPLKHLDNLCRRPPILGIVPQTRL